MNFKHAIRVALGFVVLSAAAHANVVFTATGLMWGTDFGYTVDQPASFSFTLSENTVFGAINGSSPDRYYYWSQQPEEPNLYTSLAGTGLSVSNPSLSYSTVNASPSFYGFPYFQLSAKVNAVGPDSTTAIEYITLTVNCATFNLAALTQPVPTAYDYLKALAGTYTIGQLDDMSLALSGPAPDYAYNTLKYGSQSLSIVDTAAPVPEPGTWAAAAVLLGGAGFLHLRRRRA